MASETSTMVTAGQDDVVIPRRLYDFLMGKGEIDGTWFGDLNAGLPGRFWWRALLRTCDTATPPGAVEARGVAGERRG